VHFALRPVDPSYTLLGETLVCLSRQIIVLGLIQVHWTGLSKPVSVLLPLPRQVSLTYLSIFSMPLTPALVM